MIETHVHIFILISLTVSVLLPNKHFPPSYSLGDSSSLMRHFVGYIIATFCTIFRCTVRSSYLDKILNRCNFFILYSFEMNQKTCCGSTRLVYIIIHRIAIYRVLEKLCTQLIFFVMKQPVFFYIFGFLVKCFLGKLLYP